VRFRREGATLALAFQNTWCIMEERHQQSNPGDLKVLIEQLEAQGYDVRPTPDGVSARESTQADSPGQILLDVLIPRIDGYQTCRRVSRDERYAKCPSSSSAARVNRATRLEHSSPGRTITFLVLNCGRASAARVTCLALLEQRPFLWVLKDSLNIGIPNP
jgi:CheY-like chemotaxis protein